LSKYRILTLDGGGIRGLITAILLKRLEEAKPGFLSSVDLVAGTSTGGLIALGLASGKLPEEAMDLYEKHGKTVFSDSVFDNVKDVGGLIGAQYSIKYLKQVLTSEFNQLTLGDLEKKVVVSSFDLDNEFKGPGHVRTWKAKFFHNFPGNDSDANETVVDVALRTSNAPTYFPIYQGYIDGGVVANNPSMCALAQAIHPSTGGQNLENIVLLSLGTGHNPRYIEIMKGDWGLLHWAPHILNLMLEGSAGLADYQCQQLLGERYKRVNPILPFPISMDKIEEIPLMKEIAQEFDLGETFSWLTEYY
jgi:patatin-like phospholipase/acyl hydrolase